MAKFQPSLAKGDLDLAEYLKGIKTDLLALEAAIEIITAQLDADGGVTDEDYATNADPTLVTS